MSGITLTTAQDDYVDSFVLGNLEHIVLLNARTPVSLPMLALPPVLPNPLMKDALIY